MPKKKKSAETTVTTVTTTKKTTSKAKPKKKKSHKTKTHAAKETKHIAKAITHSPKPKTAKKSTLKDLKIEEKLLENMIKLQKIHTGLAEKFDGLAKEISSLLALFELAAKSFSKHPATKVAESDKAFLDKIDRLLDQNKTIAKGLTLMEEQMRKKMHQVEPEKKEIVSTGGELFPEPAAPPAPSYVPSIKSNRPLPRF